MHELRGYERMQLSDFEFNRDSSPAFTLSRRERMGVRGAPTPGSVGAGLTPARSTPVLPNHATPHSSLSPLPAVSVAPAPPGAGAVGAGLAPARSLPPLPPASARGEGTVHLFLRGAEE